MFEFQIQEHRVTAKKLAARRVAYVYLLKEQADYMGVPWHREGKAPDRRFTDLKGERLSIVRCRVLDYYKAVMRNDLHGVDYEPTARPESGEAAAGQDPLTKGGN